MKNLMVLLLVLLAACNIDDIVDDINGSGGTEQATATPIEPQQPTPSPKPEPQPENPIVTVAENFRDGANKNLWKPVSDTSGNLVVVFDPKFKKEFSEGCTVERTDGKQEKLFCGGVYKCFGNPDRLTLRSTIKCNKAKEVKVVCREAKQTVTFTVEPKYRSKVCDRHD